MSVAVPFTLPDVAVIVTRPGATPVASPCVPLVLLTVAYAVFVDDQITLVVRSSVVLSLYVPVAWNCTAVPLAIVYVSGVTAIDTSAGDCTVSGAVAICPP